MASEAAGVLIVGEGAVGLAEQAVEAAGAALDGRVPWPDAAETLATLAGRPVLLLELEGAEADRLAALLPQIGNTVTGRDLPTVVVFDQGQLDPVAAHLLHPQVELLCHSTLVERVVALALALRRSGSAAPGHWGENEAARLAQLRAEVARIAEALTRLGGSDEPVLADHAKVLDRELGYGAPPPAPAAPVDPQAIRRLLRARRLRDRHFATGLFEDPAWDMLLDLYAAHHEGTKVSVSSLCIAAAVAPTTALRWIGRMVEAGLFVRQPDPADGRRALIALTDRGRAGMAAFHAALDATGLPLV